MRTTILQSLWSEGAYRHPRKEPQRQKGMAYDSNATCHAKQQHSTSPEGTDPSQSVAALAERYCALASEEL